MSDVNILRTKLKLLKRDETTYHLPKKKSIIDTLSAASKQYWNGLSDDEKEFHINRMLNGSREFWVNTDNATKKALHKYAEEGFRKWYDSLTEEELKLISDRSRAIANDYWDVEGHRLIAGQRMKQIWINLSPEEKIIKLAPLLEGRQRAWDNMSIEERRATMSKVIAGNRQYWDEITPKVYKKLVEYCSKRMKEYWKSLDIDAKQAKLTPMQLGFRAYWENMSDEDKLKYADSMREKVLRTGLDQTLG